MLKTMSLTLGAVSFLTAFVATAKEINVAEAPPGAVLKGFHNDHPGVQITTISQEYHFGKTLYEFKFKKYSKPHDQALYDEWGQEFGHEEPIKPAELPDSITNAVRQAFTHPQIRDAEAIHHPDGRIEYEIDLKDGDKAWELVMNSQGQILVREQE